jgi:hypothetical protein
MIFCPSIPDNQDYCKVFENDEHVANFLAGLQPTSSSVAEEMQMNLKEGQINQVETHDESATYFPKHYVSLESLFTRDDQTKEMNTLDESLLEKVQETQKINIFF